MRGKREGGYVIKEGLGRDEAVWVNYSIVHMYFNPIHCITGSTEVVGSLGPRHKTNPSADRFQYRAHFPCVILEVIYAPDEVWGRDHIVSLGLLRSSGTLTQCTYH